MSEWESSVMQCDHGDDECCVCRFLAGMGGVGDMVAVIKILDIKLAEKERLLEAMTKVVIQSETGEK